MLSNARAAIVGFVLMGALFVAPSPAGASQGYAPVTDPAGDATPFGLPMPVGAPSLPATAPYDFTEFGITDEDELGLKVYFKVVSFKSGAVPIQLSDTRYILEAKLDGTRFRYVLEWWAQLPGPLDNPTGTSQESARLCVRMEAEPGSGGGSFGCNWQRVDATVDWDASRFEAYLSKDALMGRNAYDGGAMGALPTITKGSRLSEIEANVQAGFPIIVGDRIPNDDFAPPFVFEHGAANTRIRVSLSHNLGNFTGGYVQPTMPGQPFGEAQALDEVSVTPGIPTFIPIAIENLNAAKRLINLTADAQGGSKWSLSIAPALRVPANEARTVNLIVNASADIPHRETVKATVRATSIGVADEIGALRLTLVASVPPSPQRKTLYLHAAESEEGGAINDAICNVFIFCFQRGGWMNTLETDPTGTADGGARMYVDSFGGQSGPSFGQDFELDTPLAHAILLDATKPVEATLAFRAPAAYEAMVSVDLVAINAQRVIGSGSTPAQVGSGAIKVTFLALQDALRVAPEEGPLMIHVTVRPSAAGAGFAGVASLEIVPGESELLLPLVEDPNAASISLPTGPAFLTLSRQTDEEDFLNPGRAKIFNATVLNEGIEADDARIEVAYDNPAWRVELHPGTRFRLPPGDGAKFGLLVFAPEDAKETDRLQIVVNATSVSDERVQSQLRFTAIVTTTVDLPDEASYYVSDEDTQDKLIRPKANDTPGASAALGLVAVLAALAVGTRRRRM